MKADRGIALVELIIAITIITLIIVIFFLPRQNRARSSGQYTQCQSNCKNMGTALELYAKDHKGNFPEKLEMLVPDYLRAIPTCASSRTNKDYIFSYRCSPNHDAYTFYCAGHNHKWVGVGKNYPQYNSREGLIAK